MLNYIVLDGKKYKTKSENWAEVETAPRQFKRLLSGRGDVAFGVNAFISWRGEMIVDVTALDSSWGNMASFEATFRKKTALVMVDHYGVSRSVTISPTIEKRSMTAVWDSPENEFHISVEITTL